MRTWITMLLVGCLAKSAVAQSPTPRIVNTPTAPMPAVYRPPISPYLNLLRGGDPAINYYYAVRPGIMAGVNPTGSVTSMPSQSGNQLRSGFFPPPSTEPAKVPVVGPKVNSFTTSAHPVSFGGVNRYTPGTVSGAVGQSGGRVGFIGSQPPPPITNTKKKP
ncbi:MAG: hypothetical protein ACRC8S_08490 [Fimbriiglobus sp.]